MAGRGVLSGGRGSNQNSAYDSPRVDLPQWPSAQPPFFGVKQLPPVVDPPATPSGATPTFSVDWTTSSTIPSQISTARSSAANYYNSSGTRTSATSGTARIDYIPGTLARAGLLAEEQRTNIYLRSDDAWNGTGVVNVVNGTITQSAVNGADGATKFALLTATSTGGNQCFAYQNPTMTSGATYTYAVDLKLQDKNQIALLAGSATTNIYATVIFDFTTGKITQTAVGSAGGTLLNSFVIPLPNGIYRVGLTASMSACNGFIIQQAGAATGNTFATNGTVNYTTTLNQAILFGGMMIELGAYPTSHIVTTTASVTRSADIFSSTDATLLAAKGWIVEVGEIPVTSAKTFVGVNTVIGIGEDANNLFTTTDGGTLTTIYGASDPGPVRAGFAWDSTPRVAISSGGSSALTAANTAATPTTLYFGNTNNGASGFLNGHIRMLASYSALDDTQLAYLTPPGTSFTISGGSTGTGDGSATGSGAATAVGTGIVVAVGSASGSGTASGVVVGLSATDKSSSVTVSSDGLTASCTVSDANHHSVRGNTAGAANEYFETSYSVIGTGGSGNTPGVGLANTSQGLDASYAGSPNSLAYYSSGFYEGPGGITGTAATFAVNDVIGVEQLASSAKIYKNGTLVVTFTTLPSGSLYPIVVQAQNTDVATSNFGAKAFSYLPAGDTGWNGLTPAAGSVGAASGVGSATAVGASTAAAIGSSAGTGSASAVGESTAASVGSAAGTGAATAVGKSTAASAGSSTGSGTATAVGVSTARSAGAAAGSGAATAVGAATAASVGSATGSGPPTAVGASTAASVGSSAGSGTATAASVSSAVGSAAGTGSATAVGISTALGVGSAAGSGIATAVGSATAAAIGASSGSGAATAIGASTARSVGSASGSATAAAFTGIVAQAAGSGAASAVGASTAAAIGASAGSATATGASSSTSISSAVGASAGTGTATAIGVQVQSAVGSSAGSGTASGVGTTVGVTTVVSATGTAAGSSTSIGYAPSIDFSDDFGDDFANLLGTLPEQIDFGDDFSDDFAVRHIVRPITEDFNDDFSNDFAVHHGIQRIVSGVGVSAGASIVAGTITTDVVTPPVYPLPPPPVPLVWHPAHEYRRVQPPRAIRIHRHGTELRRSTPRSMKRRYG
jgi:hypothetical protein